MATSDEPVITSIKEERFLISIIIMSINKITQNVVDE